MFTDSYERKLKGNCLILTECEVPEERNIFEERMITENQIRGFLNCTIREVDDERQFVYNITSKQTLTQLYEEREMEESDISKLIQGIVNARKQLNEYLLSDDNLILNPQYLYADSETKNPSFIFYPYYCTSIQESLLKLGLFILEKTNHGSDKAVTLAYGFYKSVLKEDYAFDRLLEKKSVIYREDQNELIEKCDSEVSLQEESKEKYKENYDEKQDILDMSDKSEKIVLFISGLILIVLISLIVIIKIYNLEKYIPVNNRIFISFICLLGALAVSFPVAILINNVKSVNKRKKYNILSEEINLSKKNKKELSGIRNIKWGNTDEMASETVHRLVSYEDNNIIEYKISKTPFVLGKNVNEVDGYLNNPSASRIHAKISQRNGDYYVIDCNSTNGTMVNGKSLSANESVKIQENDEISFAGKVFYFR